MPDDVPSLGESLRGQASVLGYALLLGIVVLGLTTTLYFGSQALDDTSNQVSRERAQLAFTQLDSASAQVVLGGSRVQTVDLGAQLGGAVTLRPGGTVTVRSQDGPILFQQRLGVVEYDGSGTVIGFEGGGVWRGTGRDATMVSPPELHYRDGTLTMPITVVSGGEDGAGNRLTVRADTAAADLGLGSVRNEIVVLEVQSAHYGGWADYFQTRLGDSAVTVDHANDTVRVELGQPDIIPEFDESVLAMGIRSGTGVLVGTGNAGINGPVRTTGEAVDSAGGAGGYSQPPEENVDATLSPLDPYIDQKLSTAPADPSVTTAQVTDTTTTLTGGTDYYDPDGFTLDSAGESVTVDLTAGNVTLLVDGDANFRGGQFTVEPNGTDHVFKMYLAGDLSLSGSGTVDVSGASVDAQHIQIYGRSTTQVGITNGAYLEGVVYAPRNSDVPGINTASTTATNQCSLNGPSGGEPYADFCVATGNAEIDGALIGAPTRVGQSSSLNYDSALSGVTPSLTDVDLAPALTFMHISANQVIVDGAPPTGPDLFATPRPTITSATATTTDSGAHELRVEWEAAGEQLDSIRVTAVDVTGDTETTTVSASGQTDIGSATVTFDSPVADQYEVYVAAVDTQDNIGTDRRDLRIGGADGDTEGDSDDGDGGDGDDSDSDDESDATYELNDVSVTNAGGNTLDVTVDRTTTDGDADLEIVVLKSTGRGTQIKNTRVVNNPGSGMDTYSINAQGGSQVRVILQTDTGEEKDSETVNA